MRQGLLFGIVTRLKPGQAIKIREEDIREAASYELTGIDFMCGVQQSDVDNYVKRISVNWDVTIDYDFMRHTYTIKQGGKHAGKT